MIIGQTAHVFSAILAYIAYNEGDFVHLESSTPCSS